MNLSQQSVWPNKGDSSPLVSGIALFVTISVIFRAGFPVGPTLAEALYFRLRGLSLKLSYLTLKLNLLPKLIAYRFRVLLLNAKIGYLLLKERSFLRGHWTHVFRDKGKPPKWLGSATTFVNKPDRHGSIQRECGAAASSSPESVAGLRMWNSGRMCAS